MLHLEFDIYCFPNFLCSRRGTYFHTWLSQRDSEGLWGLQKVLHHTASCRLPPVMQRILLRALCSIAKCMRVQQAALETAVCTLMSLSYDFHPQALLIQNSTATDKQHVKHSYSAKPGNSFSPDGSVLSAQIYTCTTLAETMTHTITATV